MEPAASISKLGFRRWYERQLLEGHAWLVTCLLCMVAAVAVLEALSLRGSPWRLLAYGVAAFAAGALSVHALSRYCRIMGQAWGLGSRATCEGCGAYARFDLVSSPMTVRCRGCARQWSLLGPPKREA